MNSSTQFSKFALAVLASGLLMACATTPQSNHALAPPAGTNQLETDTDEPRFVTVTGSRIQRPVDPETGRPETGHIMLRTYSRQEIESTGKGNVAEALYVLDPWFR